MIMLLLATGLISLSKVECALHNIQSTSDCRSFQELSEKFPKGFFLVTDTIVSDVKAATIIRDRDAEDILVMNWIPGRTYKVMGKRFLKVYKTLNWNLASDFKDILGFMVENPEETVNGAVIQTLIEIYDEGTAEKVETFLYEVKKAFLA